MQIHLLAKLLLSTPTTAPLCKCDSAKPEQWPWKPLKYKNKTSSTVFHAPASAGSTSLSASVHFTQFFPSDVFAGVCKSSSWDLQRQLLSQIFRSLTVVGPIYTTNPPSTNARSGSFHSTHGNEPLTIPFNPQLSMRTSRHASFSS